MKMTLSATARANAGSWVTTTVVQPSSANPLMTVRTSPTNSESKRRFRHIKKQQLRTQGQCTHNAHTLRLAAGELEGVAVFLVSKPHAGLSFLSGSRRHHGSQLGMANKNGTKASDHYRHWQLARPQKIQPVVTNTLKYAGGPQKGNPSCLLASKQRNPLQASLPQRRPVPKRRGKAVPEESSALT